MPTVSATVQIQQPPASVFGALADPQMQRRVDGEMLRSVEQLTPGPIGKGARFRGDFKGMGTIEYEYAEYEPDRLIEHDVQIPMGRMRHRFEVKDASDGSTQLVQTITLTPNLLGKTLWPLVMRRMFEKRAQTFNCLVKGYVESQRG